MKQFQQQCQRSVDLSSPEIDLAGETVVEGPPGRSLNEKIVEEETVNKNKKLVNLYLNYWELRNCGNGHVWMVSGFSMSLVQYTAGIHGSGFDGLGKIF